jgi:hypothetical protein
MRIISPPRHGGKASVWRNRSAIPRARRALFRFGHVGSFCQTPSCRRVRTGRASSAERRIVIHCYFSLLFIVICAGGDAGRSAQSRAAQAKFAAGSSARIVISLLLTMPRCGSAARDAKRHGTTSAHKAGARCRSGQDAGQHHPRPVRRCLIHDVKQPGPCAGGNASSLRAARTVGPRDRLRKTTSNANLSSIITLRSQ